MYPTYTKGLGKKKEKKTVLPKFNLQITLSPDPKRALGPISDSPFPSAEEPGDALLSRTGKLGGATENPRAEHPQHLLPIISHSSWQALLEETSSGGGGNHPLHQLPEQSCGQGVSKKEARGGGGDIQGQRDGEASRSIFLLPFPCIPQHPQDLGWGCVDLS